MAWGQSIAQGIGRAGNEFGAAVDYNTNQALEIIRNKLLVQEVQSRLRESEQRQAMEKQQMQLRMAPQPNFFQTPQGGTVQRNIDPSTGLPAGPDSTVVQGLAQPAELSDTAIQQVAASLPPYIPKDAFIATVKGLRDINDYAGALKYMGAASKGHQAIRQVPKQDPESATGWSMYYVDPTAPPGEEILSIQRNIAPPRGDIASETTTKDPFGDITTSIRRPLFPGKVSASGDSYRGDRPVVTTRPGALAAQAATASPARPAPAPAAAAPAPAALDASGHISASAVRGVNPRVLEGANMLLDGVPFDKLPMPNAARMQAHRLASRYGYKQPLILEPSAQKTLEESTPVHRQIQDLIKFFEPVKLDNTSYKYAPQRFAYALGRDVPIGNSAKAIAALELNRVVGAARVMKGSSRAVGMLQRAMIHLPDVWKDSPKMIYNKLRELDYALNEIEQSAVRFGKRAGIDTGDLPGELRPEGPTSAKPGAPAPAPAKPITLDERLNNLPLGAGQGAGTLAPR